MNFTNYPFQVFYHPSIFYSPLGPIQGPEAGLCTHQRNFTPQQIYFHFLTHLRKHRSIYLHAVNPSQLSVCVWRWCMIAWTIDTHTFMYTSMHTVVEEFDCSSKSVSFNISSFWRGIGAIDWVCHGWKHTNAQQHTDMHNVLMTTTCPGHNTCFCLAAFYNSIWWWQGLQPGLCSLFHTI